MKSETKRKALDEIYRKYPDVDINIGYIPMWVIFVEAHPALVRAVMTLAGTVSGALLMLLILLK